MSGRDLVAAGMLGGAAWLAWRALSAGTTLPGQALWGPPSLPWTPGDPSQDGADPPPADYTAEVVRRESGGNLLAKNPRSSASGLYQFTKATWQSVGGAWGSDPSKPFGGLAPSAAEQDARFGMLTRRNGSDLAAAGLAATKAALYAADFLGPRAAVRVLTAPASESLANLLSSSVMKANPQLRGFTVADFKSWIGARG